MLQLDPQEVVLLSFCSARMRKKLEKELRRSLTALQFEYTTKGKFIRLNRKIDRKYFEWCLDPVGLSRKERRSPKRFSIKNTSDTHYCSIYEDNPGLISCKIDIENVSRMIEYLRGLFKVAPLKLNIDLEIISNVKGLLSDPVFPQLDTLQLSGKITWRRIMSFFDSILVQNRAVISTEEIHGPVDKRCKVFKANALFFKDARWLTREHLLSLDSVERALFLNVELSTDDLIAFVKHWRDSGNTRLVEFVFYTNRAVQSVTWDMDAIVTEMGAQPWNPTQRKRYFKFDRDLLFHQIEADDRYAKRSRNAYRDTSTGFDFERSDGLLASILCTEWAFGFIVWHDRFPKYPRGIPE